MIDFSHTSLHDSTVALKYANEYMNPDTMSFYTGTPLLENAWESRLIGHWKCDEGSGDTIGDYSSSGFIGRIRGASRWTTGKWGKADSLGGTDSITVVHNTNFNGSPAFTILGWVKPGAPLTPTTVIFKKYSSGNSGYKLAGGTGGQLLFTLNNGGSAVTLQGKTVLGVGQWYHVGAQLTWAQDTMKLFVNGVLDTLVIGAFGGYPGTNTDSVVMGKGLNGVVDDMRFYNEAIADRDIRAIYAKGFSPDMGMYRLRADNNNSIHCIMHGSKYNRYLPVFQITNYWSSSLPGYVYLDNTLLTANTDYYATLDDWNNKLTIGFNRVINASSTIFIDDNSDIGVTLTNTMPKMYWGKYTSTPQHFYVKNFNGNYLGSSTANQFYMDWKMDTATASTHSKNGEMYRFKTSSRSPNLAADTTSNNDLLSSNDSMSFGTQNILIGGKWLTSARCGAAGNPRPSYSIPESSSVRIKLQLASRFLSNTSTCSLSTQWTIYPTGQIFRYDSIYSISGNIDSSRADFFQNYNASPGTPYTVDTCERGGLRGSSTLQDFSVALLSFKQAAATMVAHPFNGFTPDTATWFSTSGAGSGVRFQGGRSAGNLWASGNAPFRMAFYQDISRASISSNTGIDSVGRGVRLFNGPPLTMTTGTLTTASTGDLNTDGFNEREGAYIVAADNANTVRFTLKARSSGGSYTTDTCRFYPAFRITNYYGGIEPQYVLVNGVLKVKDYGYNVYLNKAAKEVVIQLNQVLCADADIYVSYDKTLAVTMAGFSAGGGDRNDTLRWKTESEEENQGFFVYKHIKPEFLDSLIAKAAIAKSLSMPNDTTDNAMQCLKKGIISIKDTAWVLVNPKIIAGAPQGASYGPRTYTLVDYGVHNEVLYEYKLEAVDYKNTKELYKEFAQVKPGRIIPRVFELMGNYPNPFTTFTVIRYSLPVKCKVAISIYNLQGRLVKRLVNSNLAQPGFYTTLWNGKDDRGLSLASGPYIYRIATPGFVLARVMVLAK
jgi:hypothetical protein